MFRRENIRSAIALHLSVLYLLVLVFSGKFHTHNETFLILNSDNTSHSSKNISSEKAIGFQDCLVCHFNSTAQFELPEIISVIVFSENFLRVEFSDFFQNAVQKIFSTHFLRGPPSFFI